MYFQKQKDKQYAGGSGSDDIYHEERPILSDHAMRTTDDDLADRGEVIVKIDGGGGGGGTPNSGGNKIWRESSYDFWKDDEFRPPPEEAAAAENPPSRLIDQLLRKQKAAGAEMSLDVDLEMDELRRQNSVNLLPVAETLVPIRNNNSDNNQRVWTSKEVKVSFQETTSSAEKRNREEESVILPESSDDDDEDDDDIEDRHSQAQQFHNRLRSSFTAVDNNGGGGEVLKCTSFQRRQKSILRTKTKSRLIDQPEIPDRRPEKGKSGPMKSGMLRKFSGMLEDEEDDPFDDDIPEEFKRANLNALTMIQWISLVLIVTFLVATVSVSDWKREKIRGLEWWKWEVLILVLICGRLVSGWGIRIAVFFIERNFLLQKRVLYFVYGVRKAVQNCIWLGLVLIAWHYMFDKKVEDETDSNKFLQFVNKILLCLLAGTLLWLVKTLMVKVLASSFHVSTFFDRIQESLFNQYVIETLSGPPLIALHSNLDEDERAMAEIQKLQNAGMNVPAELRETVLSPGKSGRGVIGSGAIPKTTGRGGSMQYSGTYSKKLDEGIPIDYLHKWNHKNISAWNMKRLMKMVRHGLLATLDEQILDSSYDNESNNQIRSEFEAKVAARKIFRNVARCGSKYIYLEDLMHFMKEDEALETLNLLGGSSRSEKISKSALKSWVVNAFRERRALALTLDDTKTAVNRLHHMVNVLVGIIIVIISLIILEIATSKMLVFVSSQVVVVAFVFGNTCKTIFEAVIFLFVMHPYDVGDRCEIDGVQMIVEEMNILTTIFLRFDNQKIIYPNSTLATKQIGNYYRSPDMGDSVEFCVHIVTPAEKIAIMKQRITSYIESKKDHWYASPLIVLMEFVELNQLKLAVWMRHRMNHQDMGEKWSRRALLVEEMVKIFKELDIEYRLLPRDINIRSMPPLNSTQLTSNWTDRS
ncbi:mechanosensitive ion channel protein 6-like [Cornus florida]|uniref:mechanosensitive ion channel protein 6-like n=1 Tax=Cornus florida TaxID=4283 RepID=UPI00289C7A84|nr:mechanosensitive ion channel protein 6-like [Cornus florida]